MILRRLLLALIAACICLLAAEFVVRVIGSHDERGQFVFRGRVIRPYRLPIESVQAHLAAYRSSDRSNFVYHAMLGWEPRSNHRSDDGLYQYNSRGMRSEPREFTDAPAEGTLRIALFGDSFTHGDNVPYGQTYGALLERSLNEAGIPTEVLNFGVGGYGIDQAYLRYHYQGASFSPHLVLLGFLAENLNRNLNLLRPIYYPGTGLPFAKPRFLLHGQELEIINVPVLPPDRIVDILRNIENWDLLRYEHYYDRRNYARPLWRNSKFLAVATDMLMYKDDWFLQRAVYEDDSEATRLGWALIDVFQAEATAAASGFIIVHLPRHVDLEILAQTGKLPYQSFLESLADRYHVVRPEGRMIRTGRDVSFANLFAGHYTPLGNQIVADEVAAYIKANRGDLIPGSLSREEIR